MQWGPEADLSCCSIKTALIIDRSIQYKLAQLNEVIQPLATTTCWSKLHSKSTLKSFPSPLRARWSRGPWGRGLTGLHYGPPLSSCSSFGFFEAIPAFLVRINDRTKRHRLIRVYLPARL